MKLRTSICVGLLALLSSGCASILSKNSYEVAVSSQTADVPITITNEDGREVHRATTPFTVALPASSGFFDGETYTFTSPAGQSTVVTAKLDPWYLGNLLIGNLIGLLIVDPATGSMWKLPDHVQVGQPATHTNTP